MSVLKVEIIDWSSRAGRERNTYEASELDMALQQLAGERSRDIVISRDDGTTMIAGGNDGRFVLTYFSHDNEEYWHAETAQPPTEQPLPSLIVGGQEGDFAAVMRVTFDELCEGVRWFAASGSMSSSLVWVRD